jgi:hypothetical protein
MITISPEHWVARMQGTLALLDASNNPACVKIYSGVRALTTSETPSGFLLATVFLTKPAAGYLTGAVLTLTPAGNGLIMKTGDATWARVVNGAGITVFDCDAGEGLGNWELTLVKSHLLLGGYCQMITATIS